MMTTEPQSRVHFFIIDTIVSTRILFILVDDDICIFVEENIPASRYMMIIIQRFVWSC